MAHDEHDEAYNRATWTPTEDCLGGGLETWHAPTYTPSRTLQYRAVRIGDNIIRLPLGSMNVGANAHVHTTTRRTYR